MLSVLKNKKRDKILCHLPADARKVVLASPAKQKEVSKRLKVIFKRYGKDISELSRN